jgi:hypothetical protein
VRLQVDRVGLSANNVTYAILGRCGIGSSSRPTPPALRAVRFLGRSA